MTPGTSWTRTYVGTWILGGALLGALMFAPWPPAAPPVIKPVTPPVIDAAFPDPTPTATRTPIKAHRPARTTPRVSRSGQRTEQVRVCIVHRESRGNPQTRRTDGGTASGLYGFTRGTWQAVTGRSDDAWQAPARVQTAAFYALWDSGRGRHHWNPDLPGVRRCW
jgi:hypothetical protein